MTNGKPSEVKRDSDFSVTVVFPSCRLASEFEREMKARSEDMRNGNSAALSQHQALEFIDVELTQYLEHMPMDETSRNLRDVARAALSVCADGGKGEAVVWQETDVYWNPLDSFSFKSNAFAYQRPLYTTPQAECAPRAKERLWLMIADNFTREEFEQAFVECAPRADDGVSIIETPCHKEVGNHRIPKVAPRADADQHVEVYQANQAREVFADADTAGAKPIAWLIDPGAGSAKDRLQSIEPSEFQLAEINRRGGSVTPLVAAGASNERADADQHVEAYQANQAREVFADAEKDAALTDEQILELLSDVADENMLENHADEVIAAGRAILAAEKDK